MLDIGWYEMAVIAAITIIVVGPRDLPKVMRGVGRAVRHVRGLAREFQAGMDELAAETEMEEMRKEMREIGSTDYLGEDFSEAGAARLFEEPETTGLKDGGDGAKKKKPDPGDGEAADDTPPRGDEKNGRAPDDNGESGKA